MTSHNPQLAEYYNSLEDDYLIRYWVGGVEDAARPHLQLELENRSLLDEANRQLEVLSSKGDRSDVWTKTQPWIIGLLLTWVAVKVIRKLLETGVG